MKMSVHGQLVTVTLSRSNLLTLLAKLDGSPPDSSLTIQGGTVRMPIGWNLFVIAEEDEVHYTDGEPRGRMHPITEEKIADPAFGDGLRARLAGSPAHVELEGE
jgi:hypothetical protein